MPPIEEGEEAVGEEGPLAFADPPKSVPAEIITSNKDGVIDVKKIAVTIKVDGQLLSPPPKRKRGKNSSISTRRDGARGKQTTNRGDPNAKRTETTNPTSPTIKTKTELAQQRNSSLQRSNDRKEEKI